MSLPRFRAPPFALLVLLAITALLPIPTAPLSAQTRPDPRQQQVPPPDEVPGEVFVEDSAPTPVATGYESGIGRLSFSGRESALPYTLTLTGDVVALAPLVTSLGGTLLVGPLGRSYALDLFGDPVILGPDSPVMTVGDKIVPLSRMPLAGTDGIMVPLDFLRRTWGESGGYSFVWSRATRTLTVERRPSRELEMSLDLVHIAGVTTLVMRFTEDPAYRYEPTENGFELVFPGDALLLRGPMPRTVDLIRELRVDEDRVRVKLAPGAEAAEPYRVDRGDRIQVITDIARGRGSSPTGSPGARSPTPTPRRSSEMRIVLDPGHGGEEVGAVGTRGTLEKDLTLALARQLRRALESRLPVRVLMTRDSDTLVALEERTAIANQNEADLFISVHLNSVPGGGGGGAETYFLDLEASDRRAEESARIENGTRTVQDGSGVSLMLWDLAQSRHMATSQSFARTLQRELNEALGLRDRGVKQAPFRVLIGATMPAVLVEFGFLSNPDEESKLQQSSYQQELVEAVVRAVTAFRAERVGVARTKADQGSASDGKGEGSGNQDDQR